MNHRQFLKSLVTAVGLAGLGHVAAQPERALAADGAFDNVTVQQNLTVSGNTGMGTASPTGRLNVIPIGNLNSGTPPDPTLAGLLIGSTTNGLAFDTNQIESLGNHLYLNFNSSRDVSLCFGGGKVSIGLTSAETRLHLADGAIKIGTRVVADSNGSYYA